MKRKSSGGLPRDAMRSTQQTSPQQKGMRRDGQTKRITTPNAPLMGHIGKKR